MLLFASSFLESFLSWRMAAISGRLGGGKTLLSVALADWMLRNGLIESVYANFPISMSLRPKDSVVNSLIILDEGWYFADARSSSTQFLGYGAFLRKLNSYMLTPSVFSVDKRMRPVEVWRELDIWVLNAWLYRYRTVSNDSGFFVLSEVERYFELYDHKFIPSDDGGILDALRSEIASRSGSVRRRVLIYGSSTSIASRA